MDIQINHVAVGSLMRVARTMLAATSMAISTMAFAQQDPELAQRLGADAFGMRSYVLVVLKTGPRPMPPGKERDEMFKGHFANIQRLAEAGKLIVAGPTDGADGWRGIFVLAVPAIDEAKALVATDPVIARGEMVAEYHKLYSTAGLMAIPDLHKKLVKPR